MQMRSWQWRIWRTGCKFGKCTLSRETSCAVSYGCDAEEEVESRMRGGRMERQDSDDDTLSGQVKNFGPD